MASSSPSSTAIPAAARPSPCAAVTGKPIKFAGVGEKLTDIEPFHPDRMASRILGMGDVLSLIEKAQENSRRKRPWTWCARWRTNSFTLEDYLDQIRQITKMGSVLQHAEDDPRLGQARSRNPTSTRKRMMKAQKKNEAIILSMTRMERRNPDILNASRKRRVAAGSGATVQDVNLVAQAVRPGAADDEADDGRRQKAPAHTVWQVQGIITVFPSDYTNTGFLRRYTHGSRSVSRGWA